jgi:ribose 5-phosphate isomerase B
MRVALGTDHGGFHLKPVLIRQLKAAGHRLLDVGTFSPEPCDYPAIGAKVARAVSHGKVDRGVLLCKSGGGMAIVANKFPKVRAVVAQTVALAKHSREHNDANILVLGAEHTTATKAQAILKAWLTTPFAGGRHARRVQQIRRIEERLLRPSGARNDGG